MPRNTPRGLSLLPVFSPLGDRALTVALGTDISLHTHLRVRATVERLTTRRIPSVLESVPAYGSVVVHYDPLAVPPGVMGESPYARLAAILRSELSDLDHFMAPTGDLVEIPVCYGGAFGPDLDGLAQRHRISPDEVVRLHANAEYLVYMVGFVPGFAYLGGCRRRSRPRRAEPRTHVPAGTVGIGGNQTGVYPMVSPGGWNLIGKTPARLFDPARQPAALLAIGQRVHFRSISSEAFQSLETPP